MAADLPRCESPDRSVLEIAEDCFLLLVTGPDPVSLDGGSIPGLPSRPIPLHLLRARLACHRYPRHVRDDVWSELVRRARTERGGGGGGGSTWTLGCVGVALVELGAIAGYLSQRYDADPGDVQAAVLAGFVTELRRVDLSRPRILLRLRLAALRAGGALCEALPYAVTSTVTTTADISGHLGLRSASGAATGVRP